jgi:hypothetical protein
MGTYKKHKFNFIIICKCNLNKPAQPQLGLVVLNLDAPLHRAFVPTGLATCTNAIQLHSLFVKNLLLAFLQSKSPPNE